MKQALFSATTSLSVVYGNVTEAVREYIYSFFPHDYFNSVYISTEIGYRTVKRSKNANSYHKLITTELPVIGIQVEVVSDDSDMFLYNTPMIRNLDNIMTGAYDQRFLGLVLKDHEKNFQVRYKMNRERLNFNVRVQFDTYNEAIDKRAALLNSNTLERTLYYTTALESVIPRSIIGLIGRLSGINIEMTDKKDANEFYIRPFLTYLNSISKFPITYKMKTASQKDEFFLYYRHNILVTLTNLSQVTGNRKDMVDGYYEFSFTVIAEFNLPAVYYIESDIGAKIPTDLKVSVTEIDEYKDTHEVIPLYTIKNLFQVCPPQIGEYSYYMNFMFTIDDARKKTEEIDISDLFKSDHPDTNYYPILKKSALFGEEGSVYVKIFLLSNEEELKEGEDFTIDLVTMKLSVFAIDTNITYRCIIYLNMGKINPIIKSEIDREKKSNLNY